MIDTVYTVSEAEFSQANTIWCGGAARKIPGYVPLQFTYAVFGACIGWSLRYLPSWLWIGLILSMVAVQLIVRWRRKFLKKRQFLHMSGRMAELHVQIDDSGYRDEKSGCCGGWNAWSGYTGWKEGPLVFVLGRNLSFTTVPKAPLSPEQQTELRLLLESKIGPVGAAR